MIGALPVQTSGPVVELEVRGFLANPDRLRPTPGVEAKLTPVAPLLEALSRLDASASVLLHVDCQAGDSDAAWTLYQALQDHPGLVVAYVGGREKVVEGRGRKVGDGGIAGSAGAHFILGAHLAVLNPDAVVGLHGHINVESPLYEVTFPPPETIAIETAIFLTRTLASREFVTHFSGLGCDDMVALSAPQAVQLGWADLEGDETVARQLAARGVRLRTLRRAQLDARGEPPELAEPLRTFRAWTRATRKQWAPRRTNAAAPNGN